MYKAADGSCQWKLPMGAADECRNTLGSSPDRFVDTDRATSQLGPAYVDWFGASARVGIPDARDDR